MQRRLFLNSAVGWTAMAAVGRPVWAQGEPEIVLGQTGILSGPLGGPVKTLIAGAQLAFDAVNAQGGVQGRRIRVVSLDDELKPDLAVENSRRLLDEHRALAFFGCVGSGTTAAASAVWKDSGAPAVGGFAVVDSARERARGTAYFVRAGTRREAQALVQHLTTIGLTRIAVAHLDNPGGEEALALTRQALAEHKLEPVASTAVRNDASNAGEAAATIARGNPQAVLMYLGGALPGGLMKAVWDLGASPSFYGMSIVSGTVTSKVAGDRARGLAIAQVVPYPWGMVEPVVREFQQRAQAAKVGVDYYSFEGYLNALVTIEALRRTGRDLTRARVHATLRGLTWRVAGMDVDYSTDGLTGSRFVELVQVSHGGRFVR